MIHTHPEKEIDVDAITEALPLIDAFPYELRERVARLFLVSGDLEQAVSQCRGKLGNCPLGLLLIEHKPPRFQYERLNYLSPTAAEFFDIMDWDGGSGSSSYTEAQQAYCTFYRMYDAATMTGRELLAAFGVTESEG